MDNGRTIVEMRLDEIHSSAPWDALVRNGRFNPSLGSKWFAVIVRALAQAPNDIRVVVQKDGNGNVDAVLPYYFSRRRMLGLEMKVLECGFNLMSYHAEVVANGEIDGVLRGLIVGAGTWDVLHFANVPMRSRTANAIMRLAGEYGMRLQVISNQVSPFLPISGTWVEYVESRSKKFRYKLRRRRQEIDAELNCELRWFILEQDVETLLNDMLAVEQAAWKFDAGVSIGSRPRELHYHRLLLPFLANECALLANVLYHAGRPIAYCLCCHMNGWVGQLKTSFDKAFAALSPGGYVVDACVEKAFELGAREFDFLGDADPYKLAWTSTTREHGDLFLFGRTWKGRLVGAVKGLRQV